ncbi:uncharacterized protein LOC130140641 [Syzygium oleosum]|uniref:uncharacterized protein LOC130140641 n=1 Tax=Syzygium oleosum TaxID=219896 RepID=UPI0024B9E306|nr:uncharacterized protein LOC130140641 [Syzygium oleosum]
MVKIIVIKVTINCGKDKKDIMKAVAKLEGIDEMKIDIDKGMLTIKGNVDPVCVIKALRKKCGICAEIESVGPPPKPKSPEKPKCPKPKCPKPKCPPPCPPLPCPPPPCHPPTCCSKPRPPCPPPPCPPRHCDYDGNSCPIL